MTSNNNSSPQRPSRLSRKARVCAVASLVWLVFVSVGAMQDASYVMQAGIRGGTPRRMFDFSEFFSVFMVFGVLPVLIGWGIRWVRLAKE
ncbi:MAG: hypothetical protein WED00_08440 [Aquisalimonadaceae bacterium]